VIGFFEGSGIGPEVIAAALRVLAAVEEATGLRFDLRQGGAITEAAESRLGQALPDEAVKFCESVFTAGGAVLSGTGGGGAAGSIAYHRERRWRIGDEWIQARDWPGDGESTSGGDIVHECRPGSV
jgi:isocitrate/isopropylmalate dehydrogenase